MSVLRSVFSGEPQGSAFQFRVSDYGPLRADRPLQEMFDRFLGLV